MVVVDVKNLKIFCTSCFIQDMLLSENVCALQDPIKEHYNDEKGKRCKLFDIMEGKKFIS